jgi:hypothetical protein
MAYNMLESYVMSTVFVREFVLGTEEHLEQNLLSAGAIGVDGENNHLKMLGYWAVVMISTSLAKM